MGSVADYISKKRKGNPSIRIGSMQNIMDEQVYAPLTTGNVVADYVTSIGGFPRGLVTELRGFSSSGKTTLAMQAAARHQKRVKAGEDSGAILFLDFEYAASLTYFQALGVDVNDEDTFVYMQPRTLEEGFQTIREMADAGLLAMAVVDSVAAASCEAEMDNEVGKIFVGAKAKAVTQALRMSVGILKAKGAALILLNHVQQAIPTDFVGKKLAAQGIIDKVSPGGKAIEFYTSLRLETSKPKQNKTDAHDELTNEKTRQVTSTDVVVTAFKNKVGIPHRSGKMRVSFGKGFSQAYSSFQILMDHGIIKKKSGGHYTFPEELTPSDGDVPVGEDNVVKAIEGDAEWSAKLEDAAQQLVLLKQQEVNIDGIDTEDMVDDE